jgi:hypothetical protein
MPSPKDALHVVVAVAVIIVTIVVVVVLAVIILLIVVVVVAVIIVIIIIVFIVAMIASLPVSRATSHSVPMDSTRAAYFSSSPRRFRCTFVL